MRLSSLASTFGLLTLTSLALVGCDHGKPDSDDQDTSGGDDSVPDVDDTAVDDTGETGETDDTGPTGVHGMVEGTVYLQLYTLDDAGDMELMDWDEQYGGYPFGSVFVAAYSTDDDGIQTYYDQNVIVTPTVSPAPGGDPFGLQIDVDDVDSINIYASVDQYADGIIGSTEPTGAYPSEVTVTDNGTVTNIDVTVLVPYWDLSGGGSGGGGCCGGGSGGGGDTGTPEDCTTTISGTVTIDESYLEGNVAVMMYDTDGIGPYYSTRVTPVASGTGAEGEYSITTCEGGTELDLLGAWDSNVNGLIDPADQWGEYVTDPDTSGNPITIAGPTMENMNVLIPFGVTHPSVVPFVSISGTITSSQDWTTWAGIYVTALKYRPNQEISVSDLGFGYDTMSWDNADLLTMTELPYHVEVPANTIVYLWVYADVDGDGLLNQVGEPVASLGNGSGRTVTGSSASSGNDLVLNVVE